MRKRRSPLPLRLPRLTVTTAALAFCVLTACGDGTGADPFRRGPTPLDASADGAVDAAPVAPRDAGLFDPTLGGPCLDDGQCDDQIGCTFDRCDLSLATGDAGAGRCRYTTDDSQCQDDLFCNGRERCLLGIGCKPGPPEACQDQDSCTLDVCDESTKTCRHLPRDLDSDGDADEHCSPGHDCNDADPDVASTRAEVCGNGRDDNCNGTIDESPCATPTDDTCATAGQITASGNYAVSLAGARADLPLSCSAGGKDVVVLVTVPSGGPRDVEVWARANGAELALALQGACGNATTELTCATAVGATRVRGRGLAPGTYAVIVKSITEADVDLSVDITTPTAKALNETCATAKPIALGAAELVSLVDATKDVPSACTLAPNDLTYSFTLAAAADLRVYTSVLAGQGVPVVSLTKAPCLAADELRCRQGQQLPLFARNVPAGDYILSVGASASMDLSVLVSPSAPSTPPADETCSGAPALTAGTTATFDLANHDDDIKDGCFEEVPDLAYSLDLSQPSDVLLVGRFPANDTGSLALVSSGTCSQANRLACSIESTPVRLNRRNLAAGTYRVVVADIYGRKGTLNAWTRPTVTPVDATGADTCGTAAPIPATGGYFVGTTNGSTHDASSGCDQVGAGPTPDNLFKLELTQPKRVLLDMSGSTFTTLLSIRAGAACPGLEVADGCYVGFNTSRSFLERVLPAGTYWIVVSGYDGAKGSFALDVRVVDP